MKKRRELSFIFIGSLVGEVTHEGQTEFLERLDLHESFGLLLQKQFHN